MFLFSVYIKHEVHNKRCFSDLNHMSSDREKHSNPQTHMHCYLQLKLFGKQQRVDLFLEAQHRNQVNRRNEKVKKNR